MESPQHQACGGSYMCEAPYSVIINMCEIAEGFPSKWKAGKFTKNGDVVNICRKAGRAVWKMAGDMRGSKCTELALQAKRRVGTCTGAWRYRTGAPERIGRPLPGCDNY